MSRVEQNSALSALKFTSIFILKIFSDNFCNSFPKFWLELQTELDVFEEDLTEIKSIFSALGFMTLSSIASIKSQKKLTALESEYIKMRNTDNFEALCEKFPALKEISTFTSGIIATMIDIVAHVNRKKSQRIQIQSMDDESRNAMLEANKKSITEQAKKVYIIYIIYPCVKI